MARSSTPARARGCQFVCARVCECAFGAITKNTKNAKINFFVFFWKTFFSRFFENLKFFQDFEKNWSPKKCPSELFRFFFRKVKKIWYSPDFLQNSFICFRTGIRSLKRILCPMIFLFGLKDHSKSSLQHYINFWEAHMARPEIPLSNLAWSGRRASGICGSLGKCAFGAKILYESQVRWKDFNKHYDRNLLDPPCCRL